MKQRTPAELMERERDSQKAEHAWTPCFCLAQQRYCIMNGGSRAFQPLRDRQIHATVGLFGWHHQQQLPPHRPTLVHIYISKALPSVYSTLHSTPHIPFIRAHFTASSQHSQSSSFTLIHFSTAVLHLCSPFVFPKRQFRLKLWVN